MYRLAADIFNDTAMVLDCLSPAFPKPARVIVLSFSSCLRALCGVCAGSAKASLSAHFAKRGNLGELNAKDSSQETVISLLGMLAGSVVVSWVTTPMATWATLIALLSVHLATNYAAVKAVSMTSLNRQRANIVFSHLLNGNGSPRILSPKEVSEQERIFERDGVLRCIGLEDGVWRSNGEMLRAKDDVVGYCKIGVSMRTLLSRINVSQRTQAGALDTLPVKLTDLLDVFASEGYILWLLDVSNSNRWKKEILIVLKQDCTPLDQLKAWMHAWILVRYREMSPLRGSFYQADRIYAAPRLEELKTSLLIMRSAFRQYESALKNAGWDLSIAALETRAGVRAVIDRKKDSSGQ